MARSAWIGLGIVVGVTGLAVLMAGGMRFPAPRPAITTAASPVIIAPGRTVRAADIYAAATEPYLRRVVSGIPARVYVPNSNDGTVDVIDPISRLVITHFPVGTVPHHITPSWDLRQLYVDNTSADFSGAMVKVDLTKRMVVVYAHVGGLPVDVRLAPDGSVFYVANQSRHGVSVLDPERMEEIAFIPTGLGAHGLALSRDASLLYVSNRLAGTISVIDLAARRVAATWDVGGSPDMMQGSPDGREGGARKRFGHTVSVIDSSNGQVLDRIEVGESPHGLTYFPQPGLISLGHNGVYR